MEPDVLTSGSQCKLHIVNFPIISTLHIVWALPRTVEMDISPAPMLLNSFMALLKAIADLPALATSA